MPGRFAGIVVPVLGEFNAEAVIGAAVQAGNEPFDHLTGNQVNLVQVSPLLYLCKIFRSRKSLPYFSSASILLTRAPLGTTPTCLSTT